MKPSVSISDTYNQRNDLPMLIVEMANSLPVFSGLVDFERNVIGKNSPYLFPVKILKDATARLLSVKVDAPLTDEQKSLVTSFWSAAARPLLWEALRNWEESADDFREQYISSHGVFLNALGVVGQCLLAQYGNLNKLSELSSLNIKRSSDTFVGRCIDEVTGNMLSNTTAIKLTAIKMLCHVGCLVPPELQVLERQYFPDTEFPTSGLMFEEAEESLSHPYSELVRQKWPQLTEEEVMNLCEQYERIVVESGESVDSGKTFIQGLITRTSKPTTVLRSIRAQYKKLMAEEQE